MTPRTGYTRQPARRGPTARARGFTLPLLSLLAALCGGAVAQESAAPAGTAFFLKLYATLCVQGGGDMAIMEDAMTKSGIAALPPAEAARFLQGRPGQVWPVLADSGAYRVVLHEDGNCVILAQRADAASLDQAFEDFLRDAPLEAPFRLAKTADERKSRDGIATRYKRFQYGIPGKPGAFVFTLTTSPSVQSGVQAMATFQRSGDSVPLLPFR